MKLEFNFLNFNWIGSGYVSPGFVFLKAKLGFDRYSKINIDDIK